MRNSVARLFSLLLVVLLVFAMSPTGYAAEGQPLFTLQDASERPVRGGKVTVLVQATVPGVVADGKLTVRFPGESLRFLEAKAGKAWPEDADLSLQVNAEKENLVILAFAGVEAAKAGDLVELTFEALEEAGGTIAIDPQKSYVTGAEAYSLEAGTTVAVSCPSEKFTDVDRSRYYHEGVDYVVGKGYMIGVSETLFAPERLTDRAMLVTILYRMAGSPRVNGKMPFSDVKEGRYFYDAVLWASQNGIAKGMTQTLFAPHQAMTREQMVTFLYRYAKDRGVDTTNQGSLEDFKDAGSVSRFAKEAMTWAVATELIQGVGDQMLAPKAGSTRGQVATVIVRFETVNLA